MNQYHVAPRTFFGERTFAGDFYTKQGNGDLSFFAWDEEGDEEEVGRVLHGQWTSVCKNFSDEKVDRGNVQADS